MSAERAPGVPHLKVFVVCDVMLVFIEKVLLKVKSLIIYTVYKFTNLFENV